MEPIISIITVCYNSEKTITRTIDSVFVQDSKELEYLLIDGASNDSTVEIINSFVGKFCNDLVVVSEKDNGWYDAMNKGVKLSKGQFVLFLNSDDYLEKNVLNKVIDYIKRNNITPDEIVYGDSMNIYINENGERIYRCVSAPAVFNNQNCEGIKNGMCGIRHQSMFVGREVYNKIGLLNLKYRLHADWDFMIRTLRNNVAYHYINENISYYSMYGQSTKSTYKERHLVRKDNNLYRFLDFQMIKDVIGPKRIAQLVLGEERWNEFLCNHHLKHNNAYMEK